MTRIANGAKQAREKAKDNDFPALASGARKVHSIGCFAAKWFVCSTAFVVDGN